MRTLAEPAVLRSSALASAATALACYPRLITAPELRYPVWYLEALLFLGGTVLWAFAFAWYPKYVRRPLFTLDSGWDAWALATISGSAGAVLLHYLVDPALRTRSPGEFPASVAQLAARVLFNLTFTQLLMIFAPFAWLLRLFQRTTPAVVLTVMFGLFVLAVKNRSTEPLPAQLLAGLLVFRTAAGLLNTYLFLRGGVVLVWWCSLLLQCRHLLELGGGG